ncbi:MarR family winged helix-turn-helix transcriptional regulator [Ornithinimicrobium panacihumi]|uniref:MarR family winged helix-turn-helix transcriptional regulator n=1 Tax=Ornithinimicrobium panacihumi TaxID=2008449 RepID=UPI003F8BFE4C
MSDSDPAPTPDPAVADLAHELRIACMRVARRVRFDADNAVAPHLFSILARLSVEPSTVGELAATEQVSAPTMSRAVGQLCESGYVRRTADEHDGRVVHLSLTDEGEELVRVERANRDAWMTARLAALTAQQRAVLAEATDLIEDLLSRDVGR